MLFLFYMLYDLSGMLYQLCFICYALSDMIYLICLICYALSDIYYLLCVICYDEQLRKACRCCLNLFKTDKYRGGGRDIVITLNVASITPLVFISVAAFMTLSDVISMIFLFLSSFINGSYLTMFSPDSKAKRVQWCRSQQESPCGSKQRCSSSLRAELA